MKTKKKNKLKSEEEHTVGMERAPPSSWHRRFFSVWIGLESDVLKRVLKEAGRVAARSWKLLFPLEQHLSGDLSKGPPGSERRKTPWAPAPIVARQWNRCPRRAPADVLTRLTSFCPRQRWPTVERFGSSRFKIFMPLPELFCVFKMTECLPCCWYKWQTGRVVARQPVSGEYIFHWLPPTCICWRLCCGCRSRWWQTCQNHFSPPWFSLNWADVRSDLGNNNNVEDNQHN